MKTRRYMLFGGLAIIAFAGSQAIAGGISLPSGHFSFQVHGDESSCSGNSCTQANLIEIGAEVRDTGGNACGTHVAVVTPVQPGTAPPQVVPVTAVMKVMQYDPTNGVGKESLTEYLGGTCNGAELDSKGSTQILTGTLSFAVSDRGNRIDSIVTSLTYPGATAYSLTFTKSRQSAEEQR